MKNPALVLACLTVLSTAPAGAQNGSVLAKHKAALAAFAAKDAKGAWIVSDETAAAVKKDLAKAAGKDGAEISVYTEEGSGSGLIAGCTAIKVKESGGFIVVDGSNGKLEATASILAGKFNDEAGREKFLSIVYKDETYKAAVGTKLCTGGVQFIRNGTIIADVVCPDGEKLVIRRQKSDAGTLTVNQIPFKSIL